VSIQSSDEHRHAPGPELRWSEAWTFDFVADDGSLGGWSRLTLLPNAGTAWYHAFLAGPDRQLVAVIDNEVPLPTRSLEIRTTGLWATHICETPHDHWTIGLEAFGLGVDDPAELYGRQLGDRVPLGFDLEWEADGPVDDTADVTSTYHQPCRVSGEILVGSEVIDFIGHGGREHHWGVRREWDARWFRVHGRLDDGTAFTASVVDGDLAAAGGSLDGTPADVVHASQSMSSAGIPAAARIRLGADGAQLEIGLDPVSITPLEVVDAEQRRARTPRALCRCATADGRSGHAWAEWNEPQR
jgi:hypothetical protein